MCGGLCEKFNSRGRRHFTAEKPVYVHEKFLVWTSWRSAIFSFFGEPQDQQRRGILAQIFKSEDDRETSDIMEIYWYQNLNY